MHMHTFSPNSGLLKFAGLVAVAAVLYVAREVCIPFALAVLLAFLLAPVVARFQKWHFGRVPSALLVMLLVLAVILSVGWLVLGQFTQLAEQLPQYRATVHQKLDAFHTKPGGTFDQLNRTFNDYADEVASLGSQPTTTAPQTAPDGTAATTTPSSQPAPVAVRLTTPPISGMDVLRKIALASLHPLAVLGVVLILTLFMLLQRQDLRDRILRLLGRGQLQMSTRTIDDAGSRVSRYLLTQMAVNIVFGCCVFLGLSLIGVPNSPLWALVAAALRFLPYFGVPAAAIPPTILAFVTGHGFTGVLLTLALFAGLELVIGYFVEPWLYGSRTGISPLAILGSALFWAWIWGPVGLLLATPLTVCLAVIGRHVPGLSFLHVIFGDDPALTPELRFYQRLLAGDQDEATEIVEAALQKGSPLQLYDTIFLPALLMAERDRRRGELAEDTRGDVYGFMRALIEDVEDRQVTPASDSGPAVLCIPASSDADELAASMLSGQLRRLGARVTQLSVDALAGEGVKHAEEDNPDVVCISALPPHAILHARYLAKRLREAHPHVKIVVGLWAGAEGKSTIESRLPTTLVDAVTSTIAAATDHVVLQRSTDAHPELTPAASQS